MIIHLTKPFKQMIGSMVYNIMVSAKYIECKRQYINNIPNINKKVPTSIYNSRKNNNIRKTTIVK